MGNRESDIDLNELTDEEAADYARIEEEALVQEATGATEPSDTDTQPSEKDSDSGNSDKDDQAGNADQEDESNESKDNVDLDGDDEPEGKQADNQQDNEGDKNDADEDQEPDIAAQVKDLLGKVDRIEKRQFKNDGSIGGMSQKLDSFMEKLQENRETKGDDGDGPTKAQVNAALKDSDKFKQLAEDFPEIGEVLLEMSESIGGRSGFDAEKFREDLTSETDSKFTSLNNQIQELHLTVAAPGWEEKMSSDPFQKYVLGKLKEDGEDSNFGKLVQSPKAADALKLLKMFDEHVEKSSANEDADSDQKPDQEADSSEDTQDKNSNQKRLERTVQRTSGRGQGGAGSQVKDEDEYLVEGFQSVRGR